MNPCPKPKLKRQNKAKNNPMPTADDLCEVCGKAYAHLHEVFHGTGQRQRSIEWKMQIRLCYEHHDKPYGNNPHYNKDIDMRYKREFQKTFEALYGKEKFYEVFKVNYL